MLSIISALVGAERGRIESSVQWTCWRFRWSSGQNVSWSNRGDFRHTI